MKPVQACLILLLAAPTAVALPFNTNTANLQASLSTPSGSASDTARNDSPADGSAALTVTTGSVFSGSLSSASVTTDLFEDGPDDLVLSAASAINIRRPSSSASPGSGFAGLEPSQSFSFIAPGGPLQLDYTALGTITISSEQPGNNSFVNFSIRVTESGPGGLATLVSDQRFSADGYSVTESVVLNPDAGSVLSVSIDNAATVFAGGIELFGDARADLDLRFTAIPEPAGLPLLATAVLALRRRRRGD